MQAGRQLDAQLACQRALAMDPNHADSLHLMGLLCLQARQYDHAIAWIARANQQDTGADYLFSLGTALEQQGLHREAFKAFDQAAQIKPADAETWTSRGRTATTLTQLSDALVSYQRVLDIDPRDANAAYRCGLLLRALGRPAEALSCLKRCDELLPHHAGVLEQLGVTLHILKRYEEAFDHSRRAHELNPASPEICNNAGASLQYLRRDTEALTWFDKALALRPDFIMALINKASSLAQSRRIDETIAAYRQVKAIDPGNTEADSYLSLIYLLTADFEAGWEGYKLRWNAQMRPESAPAPRQHPWTGQEDVNGKTILIFPDEGFGDTIQFARYIPMLAARGAQVVLIVDEALRPLLSGLPGVTQCLPKPVAALPPFDLHCPIGMLPLAFETRLDTIPATASYLPPPAEARVQEWERRLADRLGPATKLRVGLTWSGNAQHSNDHNRSLALRTLRPLLDVDAHFISLQKAPKPEDKALLDASPIIDLTSHLADFAETRALVECLDLVISVDTSVVHLAAASGRPTWILLPYLPDWRWLLDRDDSPWYPTARLFRQGETRSWEDVVEQVRRALDDVLSDHGRG